MNESVTNSQSWEGKTVGLLSECNGRCFYDVILDHGETITLSPACHIVWSAKNNMYSKTLFYVYKDTQEFNKSWLGKLVICPANGSKHMYRVEKEIGDNVDIVVLPTEEYLSDVPKTNLQLLEND